MIDLAVVDLSRLQFALTALYHFLFVPLTLGLSFMLVIMESIYVMTRRPIWRTITRFWAGLFGVNFVLGVATGITMEFQFGMNWSYYSHYVGDIFGAPLAIEGLMAFFLEATFVGLFFFGSVVERFLGSKRYLAFYLLCGILGACTYLLLNVIGLGVYKMTGQDSLPVLLFNNPETVLVGASAGVFGVIMASAYLMPNATVYLFLVLPMKLATLAYGLVIFALLAVFFGWNNAGGEAAHIGGAVSGFYFIRHTQHLHGFFDLLGRVDPTSKSKSKRRMTNRSNGKKASMVDEAEIDRILSKIHEKGLASLTEKEKKILHKASGR